MAQFALVALFPLVAVVWVSPSSTHPMESVAEARRHHQEKTSKHTSFVENPTRPHQSLGMPSSSPGVTKNSLAVRELELDAERPQLLPADILDAGIREAFPCDSAQYDAVSLPLLLRAAVMACWQVLNYYQEHLTLMNLDAVMGTRIAEVQFRLGLADLTEGEVMGLKYPSGRGVAAELGCLQVGAAMVSYAGEARVRKDEPRQYENLWALLQEDFWAARLVVQPMLSLTSHNTHEVLAGHEQLNGRQTDACLAQVTSRRGCAVTRGCWKLMGSRIYSGYSLTHQILFIIAGVQAGCKDHLDNLAAEIGVDGGVGGLLARMCSTALTEAQVISQAGFPEHRRDLFMEQGAVCGLLGYRAFFQEAWVARVVSWQRKVGCYGGGNQYLASWRRDSSSPSPLHARFRRDERVMPGGCLAHRSAVALGYLAVFTRLASVSMLADFQ